MKDSKGSTRASLLVGFALACVLPAVAAAAAAEGGSLAFVAPSADAAARELVAGREQIFFLANGKSGGPMTLLTTRPLSGEERVLRAVDTTRWAWGASEGGLSMAVLLKPPVGMIAPAEQLWIVCALRNTGGVPLKVGHGGGEARLTLLARGPDNASLVFHYPDPAGTPSADEEREGIETLDPGDILLLGPSGRDASIAQWRVPGLKSKGAWLLRFVYQSYKLNGDAPGPRRWKGAVTSQLIRMDYPLLPDLEAFAEAAPGAPSLEALGLASDSVVVGRIETISEPRQLRLDAGGPAVEGRSGVLRVSKSLLERRRRAPAPVTLTEKDDGRTVTLPVGGQLTVRLAGDRPGAVWTVAETAASSVLKPATAWFEPQVLAENSSDGTYVFEFSGAVPGETMLRLRYGPKSGSARTVLREIGYTVRVDTGS